MWVSSNAPESPDAGRKSRKDSRDRSNSRLRKCYPLRMPFGLKRDQQSQQAHFVTFSCYRSNAMASMDCWVIAPMRSSAIRIGNLEIIVEIERGIS
jgi:hypothetical protein